MSEYFVGDDNGWYDYDGNYYPNPGEGGGGGADWSGYEQQPTYGASGLPTFTQTGTGSADGSGPTFSPFPPGGGKGRNIYLPMDPFTPTGPQDTGGAQSRNTTNNTQNNTSNKTTNNSLSQSVGLGAVSPVSSGVPAAAASSFKPNVISSGSGLHEGAPPPMPAPPAPTAPTLHPERHTDWSSVTFGREPSDSAPQRQGNPASGQSAPAPPASRLGAIAQAAGNAMGVTGAYKNYKGLYDAIAGHRKPSIKKVNQTAYGDLYGGDATYEG